MKQLPFVIIIVALLFGCNARKERAAISGTYVNTTRNDVSAVYDTLNVQPISAQAEDAYDITQHSRVVFIKPEDQPFNKTNKNTFNATYDAKNSALRTEDPGIVYVFDKDDQTLRLGDAIYKKIK